MMMMSHMSCRMTHVMSAGTSVGTFMCVFIVFENQCRLRLGALGAFGFPESGVREFNFVQKAIFSCNVMINVTSSDHDQRS
jgi:hypothetical protein